MSHTFSRSLDDDDLELSDIEDRKPFSNFKGKSGGACADCKSVKVRCESIPGERKCKRCQLKGFPCTPRQRKKRKAAETHEELMEKARQQDLQIQDLLRQYDAQRATEKLVHLSVKTHPAAREPWQLEGSNKCFAIRQHWIQRGKSVEEAALLSFGSGRSRTTEQIPAIVSHCDLYPEEIKELFSIFFQRINPYFSILNENYHMPDDLIWSSPFLFTVVCAISSRYLTSRPALYTLAMDFARDAAGRALVETNQSVSICQAYLLMALYPVPKKKWEEDKSWLLMGVAIRMAMELGLNQPVPPECSEMEGLNRVRTWLNCYCVDASHAIQYGKMPMVPSNDFMARSSAVWYKSSSMNHPFDVHLCGYVQILNIMVEWRATNGALTNSSNFTNSMATELAVRTQQRIQCEMNKWRGFYAQEYERYPYEICMYRGNTTQLIAAYLQLVVLSTGFQVALKDELTKESPILIRSMDAAYSVIRIMVEDLAPTGYLRFAMDANFLYVSFAASFLVNLLRRKCASLVDEMQVERIVETVNNLCTVLASPKVSTNKRHTATLHSRFLSAMLDKHRSQRLSSPGNQPSTTSFTMVNYAAQQFFEQHPQHIHDESHAPSPLGSPSSSGSNESTFYQQHQETHLEFGLSHFVKTVQDGLQAHAFGYPEDNLLQHPSTNWRGIYTAGGQGVAMPPFVWTADNFYM